MLLLRKILAQLGGDDPAYREVRLNVSKHYYEGGEGSRIFDENLRAGDAIEVLFSFDFDWTSFIPGTGKDLLTVYAELDNSYYWAQLEAMLNYGIPELKTYLQERLSIAGILPSLPATMPAAPVKKQQPPPLPTRDQELY